MASKEKKSRNYKGMGYRELQRVNKLNRDKLSKENQKWLKESRFKNIGWDNVIKLHQKLEELLDKTSIEEMSLEELFLEADRLGNKYISSEEIHEYHQVLAREVSSIEDEIENIFPDKEIEIIDFSKPSKRTSGSKKN
jgi:hypothetical protein